MKTASFGAQALLIAGGLVIATIGAIVAIVALRPDQDNSTLITLVIGVSAPTIAGVLALLRGNTNSVQLENLERTVQAQGRRSETLQTGTRVRAHRLPEQEEEVKDA